MKENFLKSTGRAALAATFLLGLFLPARARAQVNGQVWLKIMAFTDAPVVGADVRITLGGPDGPVLADAKAATNSQGVFPAPVWQPWMLREEAAGNANAPEPDRRRRRSLVRISISSGTINGEPFLGHLTADLALTDPAHQILVVNPVTTLVSRLLDERPELKLNKAEALVRRFLKLPANYSLGLALRQSSGYASPFFSPVAFMTEARDMGGLDAFERLLHQELVSDSAAYSFRNPTALGAEGINVGNELTKGALSYIGGQGLGWVMEQTGIPTPGVTSGDIHALQQQLNDLQSSLDNLISQVANLSNLVKSTATQTQYIAITTTAQTYANTITGQEADLDSYVQMCPPLAEYATPPTTVDPYCTTTKPIVISELQTEFTSKYYEIVENYIKDNGTLGTEGMLHLYSLWLGESRSFFRPADSTKMQALYDYWDGVLTSAANLRMEWFHYLNYQDPNSPAGNATITAFIGNPDLSPPPGVFQVDETANHQLMFPAVPEGVVVSTVDHTMWSLVPWIYYYVGSHYYFKPQATCLPVGSPKLGQDPSLGYWDTGFYGFSDWPSPSGPTAPPKDWWAAALKNAPSGSGQNWQQWLTAQTKTTGDETPASDGWFNALSCTNPRAAIWTNTATSPNNYWTIHLDNNSFTSAICCQSGVNNLLWPARRLAAGEQYFWDQ